MKTLFDQAAELTNTPAKMKRRLAQAKRVLKKEYAGKFSPGVFVAPNKLVSNCGRFELVWRNLGDTSVGSVAFYEVRK